ALEPTVSDIGELMLSGTLADLEPRSYRIVLGVGAAETLGVEVGSRVVLALAQSPMVTPVGIRPRMRPFTVAGIFDAGMYEYDQGLALVHIDVSSRLFRTGGYPCGLCPVFSDVVPSLSIVLAASTSA